MDQEQPWSEIQASRRGKSGRDETVADSRARIRIFFLTVHKDLWNDLKIILTAWYLFPFDTTTQKQAILATEWKRVLDLKNTIWQPLVSISVALTLIYIDFYCINSVLLLQLTLIWSEQPIRKKRQMSSILFLFPWSCKCKAVEASKSLRYRRLTWNF